MGHHRRTLEVIAWKYRTNSPSRDLPDELGSFKTAPKRLIRWAVDGTWQMILAAILAAVDGDADDNIDWTVPVDSTVVRAHRHASGALKKRGADRSSEPADHALGRSRGGLSIKVHVAADGRAWALAFTITAGQAGDAPAFETVMSCIRLPPHWPRTRPLAVLAYSAYSSRAIRSHLRRRGIRDVIPQPPDHVGHPLQPGRLGGRPTVSTARQTSSETPSSGASAASSSGLPGEEPTSPRSPTRPPYISRASSSGSDADHRDRT